MTDEKINKMCDRLYDWEQQHFEELEKGIKEIQADVGLTDEDLAQVAQNLEGETPFRKLIKETINYIIERK